MFIDVAYLGAALSLHLSFLKSFRNLPTYHRIQFRFGARQQMANGRWMHRSYLILAGNIALLLQSVGSFRTTHRWHDGPYLLYLDEASGEKGSVG